MLVHHCQLLCLVIVEYNEMRNDVGIFYDFEWDDNKKEIILKRDNENNPVIRFSLFEKVN